MFDATSGVAPRTPEQAAATAKRHNKKLAKLFPLFALNGELDPVIQQWSAEAVMADEARFRLRMEETSLVLTGAGNYWRDLVLARDGVERVAELEAYFKRTLPQSAGYWADFWHHRAEEQP